MVDFFPPMINKSQCFWFVQMSALDADTLRCAHTCSIRYWPSLPNFL